MKRANFFDHASLMAVAALLMVVAAGCNRSVTPAKFSRIFEGGYDPAATFRQQGYLMQTEARGERVSNPVAGYAWQSWQGVVIAPQDRKGCETMAVLIRDSLNQAMGGSALDELTRRPGRSSGQPLAGLLRYNQDEMHGDMHVWLIPDTSEATISYVIFLREERLR